MTGCHVLVRCGGPPANLAAYGTACDQFDTRLLVRQGQDPGNQYTIGIPLGSAVRQGMTPRKLGTPEVRTGTLLQMWQL